MTIMRKCDGICVNCKYDTCIKYNPYTVEEETILHRFAPEKEEEGYGVAFDLGTTTLVASLVNLQDGQELRRVTSLNPQRKYGQDVLSRITYVQRNGAQGSQVLQTELRREMDRMLRELKVEQVERIAIAGNCVMLHLLLGEDVTGFGMVPYKPVFLKSQIREMEQVNVYCLPSISAFVGSDITAGIVAQKLPKNSLYLDIGTNGEMVLRTANGYYSCSCAVGPALEGMNISCGMTATEGAIDNVWFSDGKVGFHVLNSGRPKGLCGSGILTAVQAFLQGAIITRDGAFKGDREVFELCEDIVISQQDIRQVQLAKGAILSGIICLLRYAGVCMEEIEVVYIAGQFGQHISEEVFTNIGILPNEAKGKLRYVGNGALAGAHKALLSEQFCKEAEMLCEQVAYVELADMEDYMQIFMESLLF